MTFYKNLNRISYIINMYKNPIAMKLIDLCDEAIRVDDLSEKRKILEQMKSIAENNNDKKK